MTNVQYFTNDKFRVLECVYDSRGLDGVARITQQEVAEKLGISRVTINSIFSQLVTDGYLLKDLNRASKYMLSDKAITSVVVFRMADSNHGELL